MSDLQRIDLNLLVAFDALMAERSVTRAAERMSVGQPAMSASLARLRKLFDDPLLVRDGRGFVLTPMAESLTGPIRQALTLMEGAVGRARAFDPATEHHTFTILASDYVLVVLLRELLNRMADEAPNIRVNVRPITGDYADLLRRGQIDLFIVPREVEESRVSWHSEDLFTDRFVCAVDRDHPQIRDSITLEEFQSLPYLAYDGGPLKSASAMQLQARSVTRTVDVTTQSFVVAPLMLRGTNFLTLLHERFGRAVAEQTGIKLLDPPVELAPITEAMFWGPRHQEDPAHVWLRQQLRRAAGALSEYRSR
ncbi:LysR family transcriptional regulator [Gordonia sp. TBRC 11910]|uniref:LysR family transcriptional regulator n=1 Tax=Gordonia asplenii TaxID=2725283 RepID=A0A848KYH0_9ACTN|nr:LysR family transcriptional regulator [Gordonia asplenii]NMO03730.1 LysR family transcriptional regulator [Gordonia asplenii]